MHAPGPPSLRSQPLPAGLQLGCAVLCLVWRLTCVTAAIGMYVVNGCRHVWHHLQRHVHAAVLVPRGRSTGQAAARLRLLQALTSMNLHEAAHTVLIRELRFSALLLACLLIVAHTL